MSVPVDSIMKGQWIACLAASHLSGVPLKVQGVSPPFVFVIPFGDSITNPVILDTRKESLTRLHRGYVSAILKNREERRKLADKYLPRQIILSGADREIVAVPVSVPKQVVSPPPPPPLAEDAEIPPPVPPPLED